jgi:hypothetical protein
MNQKWNRETVVRLFYYDLTQIQQKKITYLYDKLNLPHIVDLTYPKTNIRSYCGLTEAVFRSMLIKLDIPVSENYSIELAYKIVKSARRIGLKRINAHKYKLSKGKLAFWVTDANVQNGVT